MELFGGQRMRPKLKTLLVISGVLLATVMLVQTAQADDSGKDTGKDTDKPTRKRGLVEEMSGQGYGMAGCGLGSILFGETPGIVQVVAAFTNNFYSNNTFAGTSGTSNCDDRDSGDGRAVQAFVESNRMAMQNDIARGAGETLSAFYDIAGCSLRSEVSATLQKNYQNIFTQPVSDKSVFKSIRASIHSNESTALACAKLG
jgi:hypothetical protein